MEQPFEHLSNAQIEHYGDHPVAAGSGQADREIDQAVESHLAGCGECRTRVLEFHRSRLGLMSSPDSTPAHRPQQSTPAATSYSGAAPATSDCPSDDSLRDLAASLLPSADGARLTQHAAQCDHCGPILRAYTEDFSDDLSAEDQELLAHLNSSSQSWQKKMAQQMAGATGAGALTAASTKQAASQKQSVPQTGVAQPPPAVRVKPPEPSRFSLRKWLLVPAAAIATAALAFFIWNAQRETPTKVEKLLAQAYPEQRTVEMRWPGVAWGEFAETLGTHHVNKPLSLLQADAAIRQQTPETLRKKEWLHVRAQKDILNGISIPALQQLIGDLKQASQSEPESQSLMFDLAIANFRMGEMTQDPHYYNESKAVLNKMLASSRSSVALFNRAVVDQRLFDRAVGEQRVQLKNDAIADLEECLKQEENKNEGWGKEIQQKIENWKASPDR